MGLDNTTPEFRIFALGNGSSLTLDHIIVRNGRTTDVAGGGIANTGGTLTIRNSVIQENQSLLVAGGIYHLVGELLIEDSKISNNISTTGGGVLLIGGSTNITDSWIENNEATAVSGGGIGGGGTNHPFTLIITNSIIRGNSGGGLSLNDGNIFIYDSMISDNTKMLSGAGFRYTEVSDTRIDSVIIARTIFSNNLLTSGTGGGAISVGGSVPGTFTIYDSCITGNTDISISKHSASSVIVNASNNWWGSVNGPSGVGPGSGDSVSDGVEFMPYLNEPPLGVSGVSCDDNELSPLTITSRIASENGSDQAVIPYERSIFTVTVTNNTDVQISDLSVEMSPFTAIPDPHGIHFRFEQRVSSSDPFISFDSTAGPNTIVARNLSISPNEQVTLRFYGHSKLSGQPEMTVHAVSAVNEIDFHSETTVNVEMTHLGLLDADSGYSALIFWAMFNETSEGNFAELNPNPNELPCSRDGWVSDVAMNISILRVFQNEEQNNPGCFNFLYMDVQVMLNGILNAERGSAQPFTYFTGNYLGSIGNQPISDPLKGYYQGLTPNDPYRNSYNLWMAYPMCWPLATDLGIQNFVDIAGYPSGRIGYKAFVGRYDVGQTSIVQLDASFDKENAVLQWMSHYLECYITASTERPIDQHRRTFYQTVYQDPDSFINTAFKNMYNNCPTAIGNNYAQCDPTLGSVGRLKANTGHNMLIATRIAECAGNTFVDALANAGDILTPYVAHMTLIGDPLYHGGVVPSSRYVPARSSFLHPAIFMERNTNSVTYPIQNCSWVTIVWQQAATPYSYPR